MDSVWEVMVRSLKVADRPGKERDRRLKVGETHKFLDSAREVKDRSLKVADRPRKVKDRTLKVGETHK